MTRVEQRRVAKLLLTPLPRRLHLPQQLLLAPLQPFALLLMLLDGTAALALAEAAFWTRAATAALATAPAA